ncbi:MAG: aldose epimerase family protein [Bacillota bacterium]
MVKTEKVFQYNGKDVQLITMANKRKMEVKLLSYGAAIVEIRVPDKNGIVENVLLAYKNLEDYITNPSYFGVTVGRTSGRIAGGRFSLEDTEYQLNKNYGVNHGHGGPTGFSFRVWDYKIRQGEDKSTVEFTYISKNMEENYPGNMTCKVIYTLTDENELLVEYEAVSDKKTLCNLTNHGYFNLSGNYKRKVTEQQLKIKGDQFLELDKNFIPTGTFIDVKNTPMDFRELKLIGKDISSDYEQLVITGGYDHPWMLKNEAYQIEMTDDESGRRMRITTTYPCVVIYSYNFPNDDILQNGKMGTKHDGICFETQYEPDGINHGHFHAGLLMANERYYEKTVYAFDVIY